MKAFRRLLFVGCFISAFCYTPEGDEQCTFQEPVDESVVEDGYLKLPQLAQKYGYPVETHKVQTEDGYILTVYRIPYGKNCGEGVGKKTPVLVMHGLLSSAYDYLILGPQKSLGYVLADRCYDVWLGNNRGNSESREHITMTTKEKKFWDFSWHELGKYDVPAMVDYVLNKTKQPSLHYIGHSQGTTQFFVFASLLPEYQQKIRTMQALSPVAFMKHLQSPIVRVMSLFDKDLQKILSMIGVHEFLPGNSFLNFLGTNMCKNDYPDLQAVCCNVFFLLCGYDPPQLNRTILPAIIGHTPAGAAVKQLIHYSQGIRSGEFRHFDFGLKKNLAIYKSFKPPKYKVESIKVPIALYYGANDWLSNLKDVKALEQLLPNVIEKYLVPYSTFNHLDFIFATDIMQLLNNRVLKSLAEN